MDDTDQHRTPTIGPFTTAQLYDSIPIPSRSQCIRVLDIPKRPLAVDECLTGTLRTVDLRNSPKFTALSYVWGKASDKTISCNGCDINITKSCYEALFSLREKCGDLTLWVDAVCINQDDANELAHQIPLMGEIYTWAEAVYIWLGDGSQATDKAMKYIRAASQHRLFPAGVPWWDGTGPITVDEDRNQLWWGILSLSQRSARDRDKRKQDVGVLYACDRVSLLELLDQTWLYRSWTFQEVTLAPNPILVCGQEHVTWLQLYQALTFIQDSTSQFCNKGDISIVARDERRREHRLIASSEAFKSWQNLFEVWQSISRPCRWNGHEIRVLSCHTGGSRDSCSVREYVQLLEPEKIYRSLANQVTLVSVFSVLLFMAFPPLSVATWPEAPSGHGLPEKRGWIDVLWHWSMALIVWSTCFFILFLHIYLSMIATALDIDNDMKQNTVYGRIGQTEDLTQQNHLVGLLQAMRDRESTKPQDRVFAVEGVFQRLGIRQPTPDYNRPTGEIYRDAFVSLIERKPTFVNLLIDCGLSPPGAPSWVPDWSTVAKRSWLPSSYLYDSIEKERWSDDQLQVSASGNTLSVNGAFLRTAEFCTRPFHKIELDDSGNPAPPMQESLHNNIQVLSRWIIKITRDVILNEVHESIPSAVFNTFNGSSTSVSKIDPRQKDVFNTFYTIIRRHGVCFEKEVETMCGIAPTTHTTMQEIARDRTCLDYFIKICNRFAGKRGLFVSSDGAIGSGPVAMAKGDTISIIKGVAVPMVLRKQETYGQGYVIVGPAYIDGLMDLTRDKVTSISLEWRTVILN
ncbi:heterokaryon incompatibility protein [Fusarium subglutinans]|uniref:Heterokaryon incompatibility protein n=1 Tax=Gibberella subglutinans TaxID=42677 RepID=A0A8H5P3L9_GIBSU|nr:heterokaryon incompatibility protein [Fusarium subglutinans]KAF5585235.1 heterokaryon incompatibility protein [Fusarium subglutinans]